MSLMLTKLTGNLVQGTQYLSAGNKIIKILDIIPVSGYFKTIEFEIHCVVEDTLYASPYEVMVLRIPGPCPDLNLYEYVGCVEGFDVFMKKQV